MKTFLGKPLNRIPSRFRGLPFPWRTPWKPPPRLGGSPHYAPRCDMPCGAGGSPYYAAFVTPLDALLAYGATARLTRVITDDDIGLWWVKEPAYRAALRHVERHGDIPWWDKYRAGLDCPWCCGFWIGMAVLASHAAAGKTRTWRFAAATLTLNLVAAPLVALLGSDSDEPANQAPTASLPAGERPTAHVG